MIISGFATRFIFAISSIRFEFVCIGQRYPTAPHPGVLPWRAQWHHRRRSRIRPGPCFTILTPRLSAWIVNCPIAPARNVSPPPSHRSSDLLQLISDFRYRKGLPSPIDPDKHDDDWFSAHR
jgi:hypothetical protein